MVQYAGIEPEWVHAFLITTCIAFPIIAKCRVWTSLSGEE